MRGSVYQCPFQNDTDKVHLQTEELAYYDIYSCFLGEMC